MPGADKRAEPWLRGSVPGIPPLLQPAAHAFLLAREDIDAALAGVTSAELWLEPNGVASLGFHLFHLAGSTDRLLTYARGDTLSEAQRDALGRERTLTEFRPSLEQLLDGWHSAVEAALTQLATTQESALLEHRGVGRAQMPSNVLGLLLHAAEHAARHAGQVVTTAKLIRGQRPEVGP